MDSNKNSDNLIRIEKKLDEIINYTVKANKIENYEKQRKEIKAIQNENRKIINKILYTLPKLETFSKLEEYTNAEISYLTDNYIESLMGSKSVSNMTEYSLFRSDIQEKIKTKIFVDRVKSILDSYLEMSKDIKMYSSEKNEGNSLESLNIKKSILRRIYGYKLKEGEKRAKSREEFAEDIGYTPRTVYLYQNELLDDLAPSFFGVKGLIL